MSAFTVTSTLEFSQRNVTSLKPVPRKCMWILKKVAVVGGNGTLLDDGSLKIKGCCGKEAFGMFPGIESNVDFGVFQTV